MVLAYQVAAGADDAHETDDGSTAFSSNAATVIMNANSSGASRLNGGFRFDGIAIAKDATIQHVRLQLYVVGSGDPLITVSAQDADDPVNFSDDADVTTRVGSRTTATVAVSETGVGPGWYLIGPTTTEKNAGTHLIAVIQEIVDRGDWATGEALVILCEGGAGSSKSFSATSYDGDSSLAAKLTITVGAADPIDPVEANRRRGVHARFAPMM